MEIKDENEKHTYIFSDYILKPKSTVNLRSGSCTNTPDALYRNKHSFIWNNSEDTAYLHDNQRKLVDKEIGHGPLVGSKILLLCFLIMLG